MNSVQRRPDAEGRVASRALCRWRPPSGMSRAIPLGFVTMDPRPDLMQVHRPGKGRIRDEDAFRIVSSWPIGAARCGQRLRG